MPPIFPKPEWLFPRGGTRLVCANKNRAGKIYKLRFQLNVRRHFLKIRPSYTNSGFDKRIGVNKVSGVKWSRRGVLGLAWASSSLVLLKTVRPRDGEGLSRGHGPRPLVWRLFPVPHCCLSESLAVLGGWEQHVPFH